MDAKLVDVILKQISDNKQSSDSRFDKVEKKLDDLWAFRFEILGRTAVKASIFAFLASGSITLVVQLAIFYIKKG